MSQELRNKAIQIRDEKGVGMNTAQRVGEAFINVADDIESSDKKVWEILGSSILKLPFDVANEASLTKPTIKNPDTGETITLVKGHSLRVLDQVDEKGKPYYYQYDGERWNKTTLTALPSNLDYLFNSLQLVSDDEFLTVVTDVEDRILWGVHHDGSIYQPKGGIELIKDINDVASRVDGIEYIKELIEKPYDIADIDGVDYIYVFTDKNNRIIGAINKKGEVEFKKLVFSKSTEKNILELLPNNLSGQKVSRIPFPTTLPEVNIIGEMNSLLTRAIPKASCIIDYYDGMGNFFSEKVEVKIQGNTSQAYPKKNFSIDFVDKKLRIGELVMQDSFHLKAYYTDAFLFNDIFSMRLWTRMRKTFRYGYQYPWQPKDDQSKGAPKIDLLNQIDDGALGVPDGFPCRLHINGEYYGLMVWRLKKHRDNYHMDKIDKTRIHYEHESLTPIGGVIPWDSIEIRNPKGYEVGIEPEDGDAVKVLIERFWHWAANFTDETFLAEYQDYIELDQWIDWMLWLDYLYAFDCVTKNTQWTIYNNKIYPFPYDGDLNKGMHWNQIVNPLLRVNNTQLIAKMIFKHFPDKVNARYRELRDLKIFDADADTEAYRQWTTLIGAEAYKEDRERWKDIPTNRPNGTYPEEPPTGGVILSLAWVRDWAVAHIKFLDGIYKYNK